MLSARPIFGWLSQAATGLALAVAVGGSALAAENGTHTLRTFRKIALTDKFFSEGMHQGDFNHDGKTDVVAGPYWYAGPDFQTAHQIWEPKEFDPHGYSDAFLMFVGDFNDDGWDDPLVVGFPGKEAFWYENPRGEGDWKRHTAFPVVDNESPCFGDINGDGRPELLFHTQGVVGYASYNPKQPQAEWTFHAVSEKGSWSRFQHGFGFGDINGDSRPDLMMREGWWEQPAQPQEGPWTFHKFDFGSGGAQMFAYDIDGDGDNDVVTSLQAHGYGVVWFENQPTADGQIGFEKHTIVGAETSENAYGVKFSQPHAIDLADVDGDGLLDIITGKRYWAHGPKGDQEPGAPAVNYWFQLVRGDDGAEFVPHQIDDDSGVGTQVIAADVTNDGLVDVIVGNKKGHFVFVQETQQVDEAAWRAAQPKKKTK
ncbi:FG-GAP repeat domain-containing protein [Lignipirellula cremea]|uniref:FG-GAP repeat protein n=1 Tax=Lignipirellula cremea TaxID=2528010 RepID=A0A518DMP1_9BACT|nr:VCBS repeat-containing protein [Lignipirellula cremea]QDU93093.1 FG-GAP repeat protein [Lignipirellula cremea]